MKAETDISRCKECGLCMKYCPKGALELSDILNEGGYRTIKVVEEKCIGCGICYTVCPDAVFSIV